MVCVCADETVSLDRTKQSAPGATKAKKEQSKTRIDRYLFIQMEYCYSTLRETIDKGHLWQNTDDIVRLLRQLLEALAYIHGRKVIHRDLKVGYIPIIM